MPKHLSRKLPESRLQLPLHQQTKPILVRQGLKKLTGVENMKSLLRLFVVQNKCNNIWPKEENSLTCHHRHLQKIPIMFNVRIVHGASINQLPNDIYQNVQTFNITSQSQPWPRNDINFNFNSATNFLISITYLSHFCLPLFLFCI